MSLFQVNPAVSDAVSEVQIAVLGSAPALAAGTLQLASASASGLALHNSVFNQHLLTGQQQAAAFSRLRRMRPQRRAVVSQSENLLAALLLLQVAARTKTSR